LKFTPGKVKREIGFTSWRFVHMDKVQAKFGVRYKGIDQKTKSNGLET